MTFDTRKVATRGVVSAVVTPCEKNGVLCYCLVHASAWLDSSLQLQSIDIKASLTLLQYRRVIITPARAANRAISAQMPYLPKGCDAPC